jgi:transposase
LGKENERITALETLLEAALSEIERLKAENMNLREIIARLEKNSSNSSKPPSSDIVKPPKIRHGKGKRKIGGQKGHEQNLRKPFDESQVDKIINLTLKACPKCGAFLQASSEAPKKHQQVELAQKPFEVTEYRQHSYWCAACQCYHETKLPAEVKQAGLFGPNLISLTAYLKSRCHMSYQTIQSFYADAFSLDVSSGFLVKQVGKVSGALKRPYEDLVGQLPKARHLHADETGNKENGKSRWTWCFRGRDFIVFHIDSLRSSVEIGRAHV